MTIELGTIVESKEYLNKTFIANFSADGYLKDGCSILDGEFIVQAPVSQIANYNYGHIEAFGDRYYFITDITSVSATLTSIKIKVDVLKTYYGQIINCCGVVTRNEHKMSPLLPDSERFIQCNPIITTEPFDKPSEAEGNTYILITTGEKEQENGDS